MAFRMAPEMMILDTNPEVSNWSIETGYMKGVRPNDYPIRVFSAEEQATLKVYLQISEKDLELLCHEHGQGFKIALSSPGQHNSFCLSLIDIILVN